MNQKPMREQQALTFIEVLVVLAILAALAVILLVSVAASFRKAMSREDCPMNLRNIGVAFRIWADDHNGRFPASESVSNGGWKELLANPDQGPNCWTNYAIMANELGTPKVLWCSADDRSPATEFVTNGVALDRALTCFKDNNALSYFVCVSATSNTPNSILAGDRNLGAGIEPDRDYGFSPKSGKGNDVAIQTNSLAGPVSWSLKMHSFGDASGAGNILLGDGSAQQTTSASFRQTWLSHAAPTTNWPAGHVPASPSIRLIFP